MPVTSALTILRMSVGAALAPIAPTWQATPARWWKLPPQGAALALAAGELSAGLVYASADDGGLATAWIGSDGWAGEVLIKALARRIDQAEALLALVPPRMATLTATGYTLTATFIGPRDLPTADGVAQTGLRYRITIDLA